VVSAAGPSGRTYFASGGSVSVPVSVKSHTTGDMTYCVNVRCAT
jgi:hypothetical protein